MDQWATVLESNPFALALDVVRKISTAKLKETLPIEESMKSHDVKQVHR